MSFKEEKEPLSCALHLMEGPLPPGGPSLPGASPTPAPLCPRAAAVLGAARGCFASMPAL